MIEFFLGNQFFFTNEENKKHDFCDISVIFFFLAGEESVRILYRRLDEVSKLRSLPVGDFD
jgi:hypothetical protein